MKPKDLKHPFSFENRSPLLEDQVFYVPDYYSNYDAFYFPPFAQIFSNPHPVSIEYCSGNGDWVIEKAEQNPQMNWVAVEVRFDRVRKIWAKMKNSGVSNLLIVCGRAQEFTQHYLPDQTLDAIYINFPDPWPKAKHEKHRLINKEFLTQTCRVLKKEKAMTLVTDDTQYLNKSIGHFSQLSGFSPFFPEPYYTTQFSSYGSSWFEALFRNKNKQIYYSQFIKQ